MDARPPTDGGGGGGGDGGGGGGGDGGPCVPEAERCDGIDNDCDGTPDDGFNLGADPANCGACGNACDDAEANQRGNCVSGDCVYACAPGFVDCDAEAPGCEVACIRTNGGVEACDGIDNDCDCQTDEGFDTASDPDNCGECLHVCVVLHAEPLCVAGQCAVGECEAGFADVRDDILGCEYRCPIFPPAAADTSCDGIDDDCDGEADEDVPGVGSGCLTGQLGECRQGTIRCVAGDQVCVAIGGAVPERCDGRDNDCDGAIDNGFDKQNDPNHCGAGCVECSFPNAIAGCSEGACTLLACENGWADADPEVPGCEYACTASGPEVCDGVDNDCDGKTDLEDPDLVRPPAGFCANRGTCAGAQLDCRAPPATCGDDTVAWRCVYPAPTELDACGDPVAQETLCDGRDNDCDNAVDDAFSQVGTPCDDGGVGICRSSGKFICDPADPEKQDVICQLTEFGQPAREERCNGLDDDCDGEVDDDAIDDMVHVVAGELDFWIYQYEASRPDATATSPGSSPNRACSRPGVLPWTLVDWFGALGACERAGKRLCTEEEWQAACRGEALTLYPYGDAYDPGACNGNDHDPDCAGVDDDHAMPTGTPHGCPAPQESACVSTFDGGAARVFDLSGNLREWTATEVDGGALRRIRGGGFDNVAEALTCTFAFWAQDPDDSFYFNLGFRCCADEGDE